MKSVNFYKYHIRGWLDWLLRAFPKAPRFEFLALRRDVINRLDRKNGAINRAFEQYHCEPLPRTIWMYWDTGEAGMPFVVRRCVESWRQHNPDWKLRILDSETVSNYVDMSDYPKIELKQRFYADLLRLQLLRDHGGVWADATAYCHRPLNDWIHLHVMSGFFTFMRPGRDRLVSSWFLASTPNHIIVEAWETKFTAYLRRIRRQPHIYFVFFYLLEWVLRRKPEVSGAWSEVTGLPSKPSLMMMPVLEGQGNETLLKQKISAGLPVSKLSWKTGLEEAQFDERISRLDSSKL